MLRALGLQQNVLRDHEREHRVDERHELHRRIDGVMVLCATTMPRIAMPILMNEIVATVIATISPY